MTEERQVIGTAYNIENDLFSDVFELSLTPWSSVLTLGNRTTKPYDEPDSMHTRVRMPLQQAKAMALMLLRQIRNYEDTTQTTIELPAKLRSQLGIPDEDWTRFTG